MSKLIDLTGQRFGYLTVLERDKSRKRTYWLCQCDCGNTCSIESSALRGGKQVSCGCYKNKNARVNRTEDLTGKKFNLLTVLDRDFSRQGVYWLCQCDCGNIKSIRNDHLKQGKIKSCGCYNKKCSSQRSRINMEWTKWGKLTVVRYDETSYGSSAKWLCKCDCGNPNLISVNGSDLRSGHTQSCGCLISKGEYKISQLLQKMNIFYETQKTYEDLLSDNQKPLRFDFYLPDYNCCIEYQGIQHYDNKDYFNKTIGGADMRRKYDGLKRKYCLKNNIRLVEIPYTDYDILNENLLKWRIMPMKTKIELITLSDVKEFCEIVNTLPYDVYLIDRQHSFKVNAKSMLACLLSQAEWKETWVESEGDCYESIKKWAR